MSEYRLVMKGVVKTFPGVKALDHAQLELRPGKVMALSLIHISEPTRRS